MNFFDWFSASYLYCVSVTSFSPFIFNLMPFFYFYHIWFLCTRFFYKTNLVLRLHLWPTNFLQKMPSHVIISSFQIIEILRTEWFKTTADTLPIGHRYLKLVNRFTIIRKFSSETQYLDDGCLKQCVEGRGLQLQEL